MITWVVDSDLDEWHVEVVIHPFAGRCICLNDYGFNNFVQVINAMHGDGNPTTFARTELFSVSSSIQTIETLSYSLCALFIQCEPYHEQRLWLLLWEPNLMDAKRYWCSMVHTATLKNSGGFRL